MATAIEAASARMACAIASVTDLVSVSNVKRSLCTMDIDPPDAMAAGKIFHDFGVQDPQMPFLQDKLARCCPENAVRDAVAQWAPIPATTEIVKVIHMLEAELLKISGWDGQCFSNNCCQ